MFSSKLATLFTGRNLEIKVIPLSFKEYHDYYLKNYVRGEYDTRKVFNLFLKYGGLPILLEDLQSEQTIEKELSSILKDTIKKDVKSRHTIKNITEFNHVAKYVFNNIGTQISSWNIANYMKTNNNSRIEHKTIDRYLE
ncbi:hypothetical protein FACS189459_5170 [Bacilli bacterium]|nr:hypothetical protein FACS189459_5170 [Bacilli bacterium]